MSLLTHTFEPVFNERSRILILGSFPSEKSRENGFYYGNEKNRFWRLLAALTDRCAPVSIEEKRALLLKNGVALWDVVLRCEITGSSDASIRDVVPAPVARIFEAASIKAVFANGQTAARLYRKYTEPLTGRPIIALPSTSPANARFSLDALLREWSVVAQYLR